MSAMKAKTAVTSVCNRTGVRRLKAPLLRSLALCAAAVMPWAAGLAAPGEGVEAGLNAEVTIDFSKPAGRVIRPLHGVNNSPIAFDREMREFSDARIPFVRLHDTGGAYGGHCYVDIPNIFPDFDADENDPASYRFEFTDELLKSYRKSGAKVFYRLGTTIENHWRIRVYNIDPPKDFAKWARVAEHVVRHYNEGWANGYRMGIKYWEIWNEPENPPMWTGTRGQFYEFYKVVSLHLRKCFPDIKIGGYASCGFYAVNRPGSMKSDFEKSFITWFDGFLDLVKKHSLPFDFFSWHLYLWDPREIAVHADFVRKRLDRAGFTKTESIFNEWNVFEEGRAHGGWESLKTNVGAAGVASAFAVMQSETDIDMAMYYDAYPVRTYCGLYEFPSYRTTHAYCAFKAFGNLYSLTNEMTSVVKGGKVFALAARNGRKAAFYVANMNKKSVSVKWNILGAPAGGRKAYIIDVARKLDAVGFDETFVLPPSSTVLVEYNMPALRVVRRIGGAPVNIGGLDSGH